MIFFTTSGLGKHSEQTVSVDLDQTAACGHSEKGLQCLLSQNYVKHLLITKYPHHHAVNKKLRRLLIWAL